VLVCTGKYLSDISCPVVPGFEAVVIKVEKWTRKSTALDYENILLSQSVGLIFHADGKIEQTMGIIPFLQSLQTRIMIAVIPLAPV